MSVAFWRSKTFWAAASTVIVSAAAIRFPQYATVLNAVRDTVLIPAGLWLARVSWKRVTVKDSG